MHSYPIQLWADSAWIGDNGEPAIVVREGGQQLIILRIASDSAGLDRLEGGLLSPEVLDLPVTRVTMGLEPNQPGGASVAAAVGGYGLPDEVGQVMVFTLAYENCLVREKICFAEIDLFRPLHRLADTG